jgi:AcrR family transcriptional regulator
VPARGEATKERLLDAAERLFAERGVAVVSLREINTAAGERNNAALYYHFRDRAGLVSAIVDRHNPRIAARQQELYEQAEREHQLDDVRALVEIITRPSAEYISCGASERAWLRIVGDLGTDPRMADAVSDNSGAAAWSAGARLLEVMTTAHALPEDFAVQRIWRAMEAAMRAVASRAKAEDLPPSRRLPVLAVFVEDLLDTTAAALVAPISARTRAALEAADASECLPQ